MQANSTTPQAATPQFSVAPGVYSGTQTVSITDSTPGATIYYATNGIYPDPSNNYRLYSAPITISSSDIVVAQAVASGYSNSQYAVGRYIISSVPASFVYSLAGNGTYGYSGDGGLSVAASVGTQQLVTVDSSGNVFIADLSNNVIREVAAQTGIITTIAGNGTAGTSGDGGPATQAEIDQPVRLAVDSAGNLYEAESRGVIREISASTGQISTYAGNPNGTGTTGPALQVKLGTNINGMAFDNANNLYVNVGSGILEVTASTGMVSKVPQAQYGYWSGLAVDAHGMLYFASGGLIDQLNPSNGNITIVAGSTSGRTSSGDGGPATSARVNATDVGFDSAGNMYILDAGDDVIREVQNGNISTIAGTWLGASSVGGDGDPATSVTLNVQYASSFAVSPSGAVYVASTDPRVYQITASATPPTSALPAPQFSVAAGSYANAQTITVSSSVPNASIFVTTDGTVPLTNSGGYFGPVNVSGSMTVSAVASAPGYLPSAPVSAAYTITAPPSAIISTVAGSGTGGRSTSGGPALSTNLSDPAGIAFDPSGNLYIADAGDCVVWKFTSATSTLSIYAGVPMPPTSYSCSEGGDGGQATAANINGPLAVSVDSKGNLYILDYQASRIRKVDASTGIITTYAGSGSPSSGLGDGGPATSAYIPYPDGIAVDAAGNLYIADDANGRVRMVSAASGIISTYAGDGKSGAAGNGGPATSASMEPTRISFDANGNLYISDRLFNTLRKVDAKTGIISTIAGNGIYGGSGDGGPAVDASVAATAALAVDAGGNIYLSSFPSEIRKIDPTTGIISQAFGTGYDGYSGDGGSAAAASLRSPWGMAFDASGNLYFADTGNFVIRKITFPPPAAAPSFTPAAGAYTGVQTVKLADSTANATIYYTTDGSTPDTGSTQYSGPITVSKSETIKAIAVASGFAESPVASAAYTITIPTPSIALTSSVNPVATSIPVTFTATLTSTYGTPTGTVTFLDGATQLGTGTLTGGVATYATSSLAVGSHSITAVYGGDSNFASVSSTSLTETITIPVPSVALTSSANPALVTGAVTFTATVSSTYGSPTGTVTFLDGATQIASATLSNGTASFTTSSLAVGSHSITAVYGGDSHFASASSSALSENIEDFTISTPGSGSTSATVAPGGLTSYALTVSPLPVSTTFSVSGLPNGATATFNPPTVQPSNTATSVTLTIQLPASAAATPQRVRPFDEAPLVLGFVLLPFLGLRRFRRGVGGKLLLIAVALVGLAGLGTAVGCGGDSSGISSGSKQPPKTYTLTVTATAGTLSHTETLTLTVQ